MRLPIALLFAALLASCAGHRAKPTRAVTPPPPVARAEPVVTSIHGVERVDEFAWLKKKGDPAVEAHLRAETHYALEQMRPTEGLQAKLFDELKSRVPEDDVSAPQRWRGWTYYQRVEKGKEHPIFCRKKDDAAPEQVLLDLNELAKDEKYIKLMGLAVTDDGRSLAYAIDPTGFRVSKIRIKHLETNALLPEVIDNATGDIAWAADHRTLFYTVENDAKRAYRVYRHEVGTSPEKDVLVHEEKDGRFYLQLERSRSGEYLFIHAWSMTTTETRALRANAPRATPRVVLPRRQDIEYAVDHRGDRFFIRINDTSRNFRLISVPTASPTSRPVELIAHRDDVMLEHVAVFADFYAAHERKDATPTLRLVGFDTKRSTAVEFPEPVRTIWPIAWVNWPLSGFVEFGAKVYRTAYSSFVTPRSVYDIDPKTGARVLVREQQVPGGYDRARYQTERVVFRAADGAAVPVSLLFKRGLERDGKSPLFLEGYGAYGAPYDIDFDANLFSLVDRGVVVGVAHVRGGGDLGKKWHDQGRMLHKRNTFDDFIAVSEGLIRGHYTSADRLIITGRSAGGLLIGAVVNQRPELFNAVVAGVPFVDVMNTMLDETLPLTITELEEWGDPKDKTYFDYIASYSPYDNVRAQKYPALLVVSAYNDSQVLYHEPAKWVARLRAKKTDQNPLLLKMEMEPSGHGGKAGRYERLREIAFEYAFVLWQSGKL